MSDSETPTAHLARLRTKYPAWRFWRGDQTDEFWACPPKDGDQMLLSASSVAVLETLVDQADRGPGYER
jgi:hypothetical protein